MWRKAWQEYTPASSPIPRQIQEDCEAEYKLRRLVLPEDPEVSAARKLFIQRAIAVANELKKDPDRMQQMGEELLQDILAEVSEIQGERKN